MKFFKRVKRILLSPKEEWKVIKEEDLSMSDLYLRYALTLVVAFSFAKALGLIFFGFPMGHTGVTLPVSLIIGQALFEILLQMGNLLLAAVVVHYVGIRFGGTDDFLAANKLVVFSSTPARLGGLLGIFPPLWALIWLFGLYGLYLFYLGIPVLLGIPHNKRLTFFGACLVILMALFFLIGLVMMPFHPAHLG